MKCKCIAWILLKVTLWKCLLCLLFIVRVCSAFIYSMTRKVYIASILCYICVDILMESLFSNLCYEIVNFIAFMSWSCLFSLFIQYHLRISSSPKKKFLFSLKTSSIYLLLNVNLHFKWMDYFILPLILFKCAVLAEWKPPVYDNTHGIVLVTATTRRNSPNVSFWFSYCYEKKDRLLMFLSLWTAESTFCILVNESNIVHHPNLLNRSCVCPLCVCNHDGPVMAP